MKSTLFQPATPFPQMQPCGACRTEQAYSIHKNGYLYNFVIRDKITVEDPYIAAVKAYAFSVRFASVFPGSEPSRAIRDFLIKAAVIVM